MNSMNDKVLVDTNILIYAETSDDEKKHNKAVKTIQTHNNLWISMQNITEFSNNMIKKSKLSPSEINNIVEDYKRAFSLIHFGIETVKQANRISRDFKLAFFDSLLVATMEEYRINTIITENEKDFKKIPWLNIINPF